MSRITCLISFSGSSALSTRSLRFALTSVATRSINAITCLLYFVGKRGRAGPVPASCSSALRTGLRLLRSRANRPYLAEQLAHLHARQRLEQRRHLRGDLGHVAGDL